MIRFFGDKAYGGSDLRDSLAEAGVNLIVEPKSNAVDSGQNTARDHQMRLYQTSPALWKRTYGHDLKSVVESVFRNQTEKEDQSQKTSHSEATVVTTIPYVQSQFVA